MRFELSLAVGLLLASAILVESRPSLGKRTHNNGNGGGDSSNGITRETFADETQKIRKKVDEFVENSYNDLYNDPTNVEKITKMIQDGAAIFTETETKAYELLHNLFMEFSNRIYGDQDHFGEEHLACTKMYDYLHFDPDSFDQQAADYMLYLDLECLIDQFDRTFQLCKDISDRKPSIEEAADLVLDIMKKLMRLKDEAIHFCAVAPSVRQEFQAICDSVIPPPPSDSGSSSDSGNSQQTRSLNELVHGLRQLLKDRQGS